LITPPANYKAANERESDQEQMRKHNLFLSSKKPTADANAHVMITDSL
jgi:hypothetical protein